MSLWGFDGEDSSLTPWSSLSQFDDMVWNEFGEAVGDHVVPDPSTPQSSWQPNGERQKRTHREPSHSGSSMKGESGICTGTADRVFDMPFDVESKSKEALLLENTTNGPATFSEDGWTGLGRVSLDLTAESEPFGSDQPPSSQETDDAGDEIGKDQQNMNTRKEGVQLYACAGNEATVIDPFSMSDVGSQHGDLEMFGNENVASKPETLLELGWENISNLDDMDKLFRKYDNAFEPVLVNGTQGLDWSPATSVAEGALDGGMQFEKPSPISESTALKAEVNELEGKTEAVFDGCLSGLGIGSLDDVVSDTGSPRMLIISVDAPEQQDLVPHEDRRDVPCKPKSAHEKIQSKKESPTKVSAVSSGSLPEAEKVSLAQAHRARRHAANRKRSEDRFKRTTTYRKLSPGPPHKVHLADGRQVRLPSQLPLFHPAPTFPVQYFSPTATPELLSAPHQLQMSQGVPYIHVAYPVHEMPSFSCCPSLPMMQMQVTQSMPVDIQRGAAQVQRQPLLLPQPSSLTSCWPFDILNHPPTSSLNMTPQEKIEKLRWRQQMQARMAVEQQQQLLASQNGDRTESTLYEKQQVLVCHDVLPSQWRTSLKSQSDLVMTPVLDPLEDRPRLGVKEGEVPSTKDKGEVDYSLEDSVLCQLKSTVSALDMGTRLCIRDALFRLARSSTKRRAAGTDILNGSHGSNEQNSDANAVEYSTASGPPTSRHSKASSMSVVETQTNPIDRSIAELLFSKPQPVLFGRPCAYA